MGCHTKLACALLITLFAIWSVPGTIAFRNALLCLMLLLVLYGAWVRRSLNVPLLQQSSIGRFQFILLATMTVWMLICALTWAHEPAHVLAEIRGQWIIPLICYFLGYYLVNLCLTNEPSGQSAVFKCIFFGTLPLVLLSIFFSGIFYIQNKSIPYIVGSSALAPHLVWEKYKMTGSLAESIAGESPDKFSMVIYLYLSLLLAEFVCRLIGRRRFLPISRVLYGALLIIGLAALYLNRSRNGNFVFIVTSLASGMIILYAAPIKKKISKLTILIGFMAILFMATILFIKSDHRWTELIETVPMALDSNNKAWLSRNPERYPVLKNGQRVDASNYERVAWAKEGFLLILDNPLGFGYNRNAFGDALDQKYHRGGLSRGGHSHSGLIDFAIANGILGLVLWVAFLISILCLGIKELRCGNVWLGAFVLIYVSGFFCRSLLDSVLRDHYLQQFMFISGLVVALVRQDSLRKLDRDVSQEMRRVL